MSWFLAQEPWVYHLAFGVSIVAVMACASICVARMGKSPLWVLLLLVPVGQIVVIWYLAFCRWPSRDPEPRPSD